MSSSNQRPANRGFRSVLRCAISHYRQSPSLSAPEPLVGSVAGFFLWNLADDSQPSQPIAARLPVVLPEGATLRGYLLTLSPDGTQLVYPASRGGTTQLYVRALDQLESKPILHTEGAMHPFFSPDGKWVGFFSRNERALKKVSVMGGTPQTLCEMKISRGSSWGQDGTIVFGQRPGLWRVSDAGGTPEELTGVQWGFRPQILPGVRQWYSAASGKHRPQWCSLWKRVRRRSSSSLATTPVMLPPVT